MSHTLPAFGGPGQLPALLRDWFAAVGEPPVATELPKPASARWSRTLRRSVTADQLEASWLFPGALAGRPLGPVVLGGRLRALGIEPIRMRNAARAQLAAEIPPALLVEAIGVHAGTATRSATLSAGNSTASAADLSSS